MGEYLYVYVRLYGVLKNKISLFRKKKTKKNSHFRKEKRKKQKVSERTAQSNVDAVKFPTLPPTHAPSLRARHRKIFPPFIFSLYIFLFDPPSHLFRHHSSPLLRNPKTKEPPSSKTKAPNHSPNAPAPAPARPAPPAPSHSAAAGVTRPRAGEVPPARTPRRPVARRRRSVPGLAEAPPRVESRYLSVRSANPSTLLVFSVLFVECGSYCGKGASLPVGDGAVGASSAAVAWASWAR